MRRLAFLALVLAACSADIPGGLKDGERIWEYTGFNYGNDDSASTMILHFEDPRTGTKLNVENSDLGFGTEELIARLDYLNKGDCYILPMDTGRHEQVPCG